MSNPPHFIDRYEGDIRAHDPEWQIHRNFFETVSDHLAADGVIVLQENNRGSVVETFRPMIEQSGFEIFFTRGDYPTLTEKSSFYFIGIGRRAQRPNGLKAGTSRNAMLAVAKTALALAGHND